MESKADDTIAYDVTALEMFEVCYTNTANVATVSDCSYTKLCIDMTSQASTSIGMSICAKQGYEIWTEKLNGEYEILRYFIQGYAGNPSHDLDKSQDLWTDYISVECEARAERNDYMGAVSGATKYSCLAKLTALRTAQFKSENQGFISKGYKPPN